MDKESEYNLNYVVIDTETTVKNKGADAIGKLAASPFHPDNRIVCIGIEDSNGKYSSQHIPKEKSDAIISFSGTNHKLIVGQNIKFDMHHIFAADSDFQYGVFPAVQIWDTQLAEYLLSGQQTLYASLDYLSEKYGGTLKTDVIKEMWDNGIDTEDMPKEVLLEYMKYDVQNTHLVFKAQLEKADELGMIPFIMSQMDALKCTIEMEYNGMHFNTVKADEVEYDLDLHVADLNCHLSNIAAPYFNGEVNINIDSTKQLASVIFGGTYKIKVDKVTLDADGKPYIYKSGKKKGQPKTKKAIEIRTIDGFAAKVLDKYKTPKGGLSTSDEVLKDILNSKSHGLSSDELQFLTNLMEYRTHKKQLITYFIGYSDLTWPTDSCIHHGLNHVSTGTGRLSSTNPNLQNTTNKGD